jgi:hypothetical protein
VLGETRAHRVVERLEPLVGDVHLPQAAVELVGALVEPRADVLPVLFRQGHGRLAGGRLVRRHQGAVALRPVGGLGLDALPVLLGVARGTALRLGVLVRVAPARLHLVGVLLRVLAPEDLELLLGREVESHLACLHGVLHGRRHLPQLLDPGGQQPVLAAQVCARVRVRVVEQGGDLLEREAELPVEQDLLQPVEVGVVVAPVARVAAFARDEQADVVVVVQRAHRDTGEARDLSHGVAHFRSLLLPRSTVGPHAT